MRLKAFKFFTLQIWILLGVCAAFGQIAAPSPTVAPLPAQTPNIIAVTAPTPTTIKPAPVYNLTAPPGVPAQNSIPQSSQIDSIKPLSLDDAVNLSLKQASAFKAAQINEQLAAQDVQQAKAAFYPRVVAAPNVIYTTPSLGKTVTAGVTDGNFAAILSRPPSFLGANAVTEFQGLVTTSGEIDTSGRLKATLLRNKSLLEAARLGGEVARRDLIGAVYDAYYNFALSTLRRRGAAMSLQAARDFEDYEKLQLDAGEIAPVDFVRARLQTAQRADELEQARANEAVAADNLRVFVGYEFTAPIAAEDLLVQMPVDNEIETFAQDSIQTRPEFAQFAAERQAAGYDLQIAQKERRPQITYSVSGGFISDSLLPRPIYNSLGVQAQIGVTIPIFDKGASRLREAQAQLKLQQAENNRLLAQRQFAQTFYTSRTQAISARTRLRQLAASLTDAEMNVAASQARYRAGEAPITEVTDANNTLVTLRQSLYQAIFDYQTARSRLLRAAGK